MKAKYQGKVDSITRNEWVDGGDVKIKLWLKGQVVERAGTFSKKTRMDATLWVKPVVADELTFGSTITITIADEDLQPEL